MVEETGRLAPIAGDFRWLKELSDQVLRKAAAFPPPDRLNEKPMKYQSNTLK
jgi:hypothetical protein